MTHGRARVSIAPKPVGPLDIERLAARQSVVLPKRRAGKPAKSVGVNIDASWHEGMAGLAYVSSSLGNRAVLVACRGTIQGEYLALLMAMGDAEKSEVPGQIDFCLHSTAVANLIVGETPELVELHRHVKAMLSRHPQWRLILVERERNRMAQRLARRTLRQWQEPEKTSTQNGTPGGESLTGGHEPS
jgi:ribonuclease HI